MFVFAGFFFTRDKMGLTATRAHRPYRSCPTKESNGTSTPFPVLALLAYYWHSCSGHFCSELAGLSKVCLKNSKKVRNISKWSHLENSITKNYNIQNNKKSSFLTFSLVSTNIYHDVSNYICKYI